MNGKDLLTELGNISQKYYEEAEQDSLTMSHRTLKRPLLIAAILAMLLLLVGCAVYFCTLEQLVVIDHEKEVIAIIEENRTGMVSDNSIEAIPETTEGPYVAEKVLCLQGYEGSPAYCALQEWWEYAIDYTIQNPELRFTSDYQRPEAYTKYPCYSQDMVDKVD